MNSASCRAISSFISHYVWVLPLIPLCFFLKVVLMATNASFSVWTVGGYVTALTGLCWKSIARKCCFLFTKQWQWWCQRGGKLQQQLSGGFIPSRYHQSIWTEPLTCSAGNNYTTWALFQSDMKQKARAIDLCWQVREPDISSWRCSDTLA